MWARCHRCNSYDLVRRVGLSCGLLRLPAANAGEDKQDRRHATSSSGLAFHDSYLPSAIPARPSRRSTVNPSRCATFNPRSWRHRRARSSIPFASHRRRRSTTLCHRRTGSAGALHDPDDRRGDGCDVDEEDRDQPHGEYDACRQQRARLLGSLRTSSRKQSNATRPHAWLEF